MVSSLAERLRHARRRMFVGRSAELALFQSALASRELPFHLLYVYGPGGIGKTSLTREFVALASQAGLPAYFLDARNLEPTPDSLTAALRIEMRLGDSNSPIAALAAGGQIQVLVIDTYEALAPLDGWLRDTFLPALPETTLVVLASRLPPSAEWQADPGWQTLIRTVALRNLSPDEGREYLLRRDLPSDQYQKILDFTHGHALALSLVADTFAQRGDAVFDAATTPDIVKTLLERFVQRVPGPAHRAALEACALVRSTNEPLLAHMLGMPGGAVNSDSVSTAGAHELFDWLRTLSFIESGPEGVFPHDLARDTLAADLRWRNPDWYKELHRRSRNYYWTHFQNVQGLEQQRLLFDYVFLHRESPVIRTMLEWQIGATLVPDALREADRAALLALVGKHEGEESASLAAAWFECQPQGVTVYRDERGRLAGFMAMVELGRATPDQRDADPATRTAWEYVLRHAPLRPGELATHYRFWMANESYQQVSPVQTLIFLNTVRYQLLTPGLAYHFLPAADPELWAGAFAYANLTRIPEADYTIGGRTYGVYTHDWRAQPPLAWLKMLAEREVGEPRATVPPSPPPALIVLSQTEFVEAVQHALKYYTRPDLLRSNPLLRSRLVVERAGAAATDTGRVAALLALLNESFESWQASPRDAKLYRALLHTYLRPEATQERAAEALDLPFSTYRRHLKAAVTRVVEWMWEHELESSK